MAFWDEITRVAQEAEGRKIGDDHMVGKWRIVLVHDLPFSDQRLNGKIPKVLKNCNKEKRKRKNMPLLLSALYIV